MYVPQTPKSQNKSKSQQQTKKIFAILTENNGVLNLEEIHTNKKKSKRKIDKRQNSQFKGAKLFQKDKNVQKYAQISFIITETHINKKMPLFLKHKTAKIKMADDAQG